MPRWTRAALLIGIVLLFLVANRGAYKGYFQDDDLDNLAWTPYVSGADFAQGLVSPVFSRNNFRPVGHFYFHAMERMAGLHFRPYVAALQLLHLLNGGLIWLVLRRLKVSPIAALTGTLFFLFHAATFDAYWQPMYVFDVFCGTFCLLSFLAFANRRWVLSFACFWLAYKSKEVAVMLPAVLAIYEWALGERKWKPLVPFFLVSLSFGSQALLSNANTNDAYTLKLSGATLLNAVVFYFPKFLLSGLAAAAAVLTVVFLRDRRAWIGVAAALLFLAPLLALPNRMSSVYLYVPLLGAAIAVAAILDRPKGSYPLCALFLVIWFPVTYLHMREYRKGALTAADENRAYVAGLAEFVQSSPQVSAFIEDGAPASMHRWGIEGALRYLSKKPTIQLASVNSPEAKTIFSQTDLAVLSWDALSRKVLITQRDAASPYSSYINIRRSMPVWQFGEGWFGRENLYRWTKPSATVTLMRPEGAKQFEVTANIGPVHIRDIGKLKLEVLLNGESIGEREFTVQGWQKRVFPLKSAPAGLVTVEFRSSPPYRPVNDARSLGIALGGFGFQDNDLAQKPFN